VSRDAFNATYEIVKNIRPSSSAARRTSPLHCQGDGFERLMAAWPGVRLVHASRNT